MGRTLAICGWLATHARRAFRGPLQPLRPWGAIVAAAVLVIVAALPIVVPMLDPQPQDATVEEIAAGAVTEPSGWVRLQAHIIVPLRDSPTGETGSYGLLVDEADTLQAIVVRSDRRIARSTAAAITGHATGALVQVDEELPLEATVFGAPPNIAPTLIVDLDPVAKPERVTLWPLAVPPLLLALALVVGWRAGYPVFQPTSEVDVLSSPLAPGERVPAAFGGRLGSTVRELADPGAALLVLRPGPAGNNVLSLQQLPEDGRAAPPPFPIGGGLARGRIGWVYTVSEAVPALTVRAGDVNATLIFAKTGERDRVAALVAVDRD